MHILHKTRHSEPVTDVTGVGIRISKTLKNQHP